MDYGLRVLGQAGDIPEVLSVCPTTAPAVIVWNVGVELDDWVVEICPQGSLMGVVASAWDPNEQQLAFLWVFVFWIVPQRPKDLCFASAIWNTVLLGKKKKFFLQLDYVINNRHAIPFRELEKVHWVMLMFF